jgi:hypothetical protein
MNYFIEAIRDETSIMSRWRVQTPYSKVKLGKEHVIKLFMVSTVDGMAIDAESSPLVPLLQPGHTRTRMVRAQMNSRGCLYPEKL